MENSGITTGVEIKNEGIRMPKFDEFAKQIEGIEHWIDVTLEEYQAERVCCLSLKDKIGSFYPDDVLENCFYVETNSMPKPEFARSIPGAPAFLDMAAAGITYKNTYFVIPGVDISTHVHEIVHTLQWQMLGAANFIQLYIYGVQSFGYRDSPLEVMAYDIQEEFEQGVKSMDVVARVEKELHACISR